MFNFFRKRKIAKYAINAKKYIDKIERDAWWEAVLKKVVKRQKAENVQNPQSPLSNQTTILDERFSKRRSYDPIHEMSVKEATLEKIEQAKQKGNLRYALPIESENDSIKYSSRDNDSSVEIDDSLINYDLFNNYDFSQVLRSMENYKLQKKLC